ncbi:MAG: HTTM domain-containing protein [Myxococcota bacterium]
MRQALMRPVAADSTGAFRVLFGLLMCGGLIRYVAQGWVETVLVEPTFFFKYPGFEWVVVFEPPLLHLWFAGTAALALLMAFGIGHPFVPAAFGLAFAYIQLMDVTNYLNHYVLVVLLSGLLAIIPSAGSVSWKTGFRADGSTVPVWALYLLRFQVGCVYVHAALAKLGVDWLWHGQPMNLWMSARNELPLIGSLIGEPAVALGMSWAGLLYDASIVPLLLWKRTRIWAYIVVVVFHGFTWLFFDIGLFPFIMTVATTLFFAPDWPRKLGLRFQRHRALYPPTARAPMPVLGFATLALYGGLNVFIPLRHWVYPGDVLWTEEGMRFAWKVMVREKNGAVTYRVKEPASGREWLVSPQHYLDWRQTQEMSGQPDLIVQLGKHIGWDFRKRGIVGAEVRVEALVSLNGRAPRLLIDPNRDLMTVEVGWVPADWILPGPTDEPPTLRLVRH